MTCEFETLEAATSTDALADLFAAWCLSNELPHISADELLLELYATRNGEGHPHIGPVNDDQISFVESFCEQWETVQAREDSAMRA